MAKRTVQHAVFRYVNPKGVSDIAFSGQEIEVDGDWLARGEEFGAFVPEGGRETAAPEGTELETLDPNASDAEVESYLASAKVGEVVEQARGYDTAQVRRLIAAEAAGKNRQTLITKLEELEADPQPSEV